MDAQEMLEQLEMLAQKLSIQVRYERCNSRGGICRVKEDRMIIIRKTLTVQEKAEILGRALSGLSLEETYLVPEVRQFLESFGREKERELRQDEVSGDARPLS
ncbi:MAG: hypothetical protein GXP58_07350 [Deltaproteobacteria bacterium]|nr:hypothetical protein [Deltaproteobacteria bacterium]